MDKTSFNTIEKGCLYALPQYKVNQVGIQPTGEFVYIPFIRGSKDPNEAVDRQEGILHETLLAMILADLEYKNKLVPSREGSLAITNVEQALLWLQRRQQKREQAGTQGTYQK